MEADWFRRQLKIKRKTAEDVALAAGRHRSNVSHILAGKQAMSLDWARAFAEVMDAPLDEVMSHAGMLDQPTARAVAHGFSDGDAAPFVGQGGKAQKTQSIAEIMGGGKPGVDVWTVRTNALCLAGYLPGDAILVDTNAAERARSGDTVIAQHYDAQSGTAKTLLRRFETPVLVAASPEQEHQRVLFVDGQNVVVRGVILASWRQRSDRHTQP
ncbi:hypothetical protein SAMN05216376_111149 [Mameliella alba]|uniref:HTH cro/C1-type domain-containing protein n=2 Tax=Mameliella alba TaxID=561184 RepID=A0A0B3RQY8_9RHOB|nr:helix-turn-helix transcriptional regulator [Mameliella alba]KHQ50307.1 hypothetical protein OA50_05155 [Mameliella alba]OWV39423.1 XRE family transcriptional regulator [Mameliella alba]OWV46466.1 XRE family transcriptional regulator [Mameliella alba]PTR37275.1 hypothetical protein LX94_03614 [Mameliella alba]SDD77236.1 hypothetical protein SAMN05216376_111149 [Mameliella alba]